MRVAWTGHRPDVFRDPQAAHAAVDAEAARLKRMGAVEFLVGGQRGVDTWAALAAISEAVPFTMILPLTLQEFTRDWTQLDRAVLERALAQATEVRVAAGYVDRNRQLANGSDLLVAVWSGIRGGGTAETIAFSHAAGTPVHEIILEAAPDADSAQGRGI